MGAVRIGRIVVSAGCLLLGLLAAQGKALLKPAGESAHPLPVKAVEASATVTGPCARTRLVYTFVNTAEERIEADFLYELPEHAVATGFAYWCGEEKVTARIVEKERARTIQKYMTARILDPALVEMVDSHTLRAKIFPVMPNNDLKVEIEYVQMLPTEAGGAAVYALPLAEDPKADPLDSVNISVKVEGDAGIREVTNNYGLPVTRAGAGYQVSFTGEKYRFKKELRVRVSRPAALLRALLLAAPSGGKDGFFALAVTPAKAVKRPRVTISGGRTFDVVSTPPAALKAHQAAYVVGRYRGAFAATVTLSGVGYRASTKVAFRTSPISGHPGVFLWAGAQMTSLAAKNRNRARVLAMSERYGIPSKFTSWLAIPKEERKQYMIDLKQMKISNLQMRLADIEYGQAGAAEEARQIRKELKALGVNPDHNPHAASWAIWEWQRADQLAGDISKLLLAHKEDSKPYRSKFAELKRRAKHIGYVAGDFLLLHIDNELSEKAVFYVSADVKTHGDANALQPLMTDLRRIARSTGYDAEVVVRYYLFYASNTSYAESCNNFETACREENLDPKRKEELIAEVVRAYATYTKDPNPERLIPILNQQAEVAKLNALNKVNERISGTIPEAPFMQRQQLVNDHRIAVEEFGDRYASKPAAYNNPAEPPMPWAVPQDPSYRGGDPLLAVDAPADARNVTAIFPNLEIKPLAYNADRKRWEARFDVPMYAKSGDYQIRIVITLKDGKIQERTQNYHVDLDPPTGTLTTTLVGDPAALRVEVTASADTARVAALLPWGGRGDLRALGGGRFFGLFPLPPGLAPGGQVSAVLTDAAHNRATLNMEVK